MVLHFCVAGAVLVLHQEVAVDCRFLPVKIRVFCGEECEGRNDGRIATSVGEGGGGEGSSRCRCIVQRERALIIVGLEERYQKCRRATRVGGL